LFTKWGDFPCFERKYENFVNKYDNDPEYICTFCDRHNKEYILLKEHIKNHKDYQKYKTLNKMMLDYCLTHREQMTDELNEVFDKLKDYTDIKNPQDYLKVLIRYEDKEYDRVPYINLNQLFNNI